MKKVILVLILLLLTLPGFNARSAPSVSGNILLQVEENGEAWYVYPRDQKRYFLGRPADAFRIMKKLSLGAKHQFLAETETFPERLAGIILLDVEENGEAYYIHPFTLKKHYLNRPADAFRIMRELGRGITNQDLAAIAIGESDIEEPQDIPKTKVLIPNVPFAAQAPFGDWSDPRQQDGCEEASALLAIKWARGEGLTRQEALEGILELSDFLEKKYGEYRDTSLPDMKKQIFEDYFNYQQVRIERDVAINDIVRELQQGNLLLAPMNGQTLPNPYYTPPGPSRHMLVIRGYDPEKKIFITNDPGTKHGELFEYDARIFHESIRAYPTGYHEPITEISRDVIVVEK